MKFDSSIERLLMFIFGASLIIHILSCLWVFFCKFADEDIKNGKSFIDKAFTDKSKEEQYLTSLYFIITTFSTVGYGDISASNNTEMVLCIFAMIAGVAAFAYGTSTFTNLLQNYDVDTQKLNKNIDILNKIKSDHKLPLELYENVKRSLKFQFENDIKD